LVGLPGRPAGPIDRRTTRALSSEENKREPERPEEAEAPEVAEEAREDASQEPVQGQPGVDPGSQEDSEAPAEEEIAAQTGASEEDPEEDLAALRAELEAARLERDEYLDALRRLKAEFENSRKRQERERSRLLETASERLVVELLPVLDNLDRALEAEGDIREGVRATRDQLADVLGNEGLLPIASDGQPFDPNVHEAVMGQPSDEHEEGTVLLTFERGYVLNGKPIRPAKVVVARQG
jgi:molecular chaperone GrpE